MSNLHCLWVISCLLACSVLIRAQGNGAGRALVYNGSVTDPVDVPWHAGIYAPDKGVYRVQCGGTLVSPNLVVTAAHCFWDEAASRASANIDLIQVTLGKFYREWHLDTSNPAVQRLRAHRVVLHPRFRGFRPRFLEYDLAVVELASWASLTASVRVANIDWDNTLASPEDTGVVAGWGLTEDGGQSYALRSITLPFIDHDTCYDSLASDQLKENLTFDKFCAGFLRGNQSVCPGDSGGGFVVTSKRTRQMFLRGVVSVDFRPSGYRGDCYQHHYTGFTDVSEQRYLAWIREEFPSGFPSRPPMKIEPKYAHINSSETVTITCNAGQSLAACQFRRDDHLIDLSQGQASRPPAGNKYFGTGLKKGECGVEMTGFSKESSYRIGCRVRSQQGGWVYDTMSVVSNDRQRLYFDSEPQGDVVALPGDNLTLLYRLKSPTKFTLNTCIFTLPNYLALTKLRFNDGVLNSSTNEAAKYFGWGFRSGECGVQLLNVTDKINGLRFAEFSDNTTRGHAHLSSSIIVAKPPDAAVLKLDTVQYTEGEMLTATCTARNSRPVANMTWYMGDDVIRNDKDDDSVISDVWRWSHSLQSISQTMSRRLTVEDNGKRLICRTRHLAIPNEGAFIDVSYVITVRCKNCRIGSGT